ncbi:TonB-dependent receptor [Luteitalea sp.]|uniref:TonB-dependent receptor n=1 Tax=Luteitalea sp. TaxID=2004800 RepID=UPI0025C5CBDE|nr:TonB-dependent receptor [Luteitalea sp.]
MLPCFTSRLVRVSTGLALGLGLSLIAPSPAVAQSTAPAAAMQLTGRVLSGESRQPVAGATVVLEERRTTVFTDDTGAFTLPTPASGLVHVRVSATGFLPMRTEVTLADPLAPLEVLLQEDLHYAEAVTVGPEPRDPFESYQPTSVLSGQELSIKLEGSLGGLLRNEPGVSERSLGPGPSRPIIRGQDGDRVLILQNSQRTADLSSQSGDHGVTINPAAATQVEVVRGPATLLYGANAIGGLVNVISNQIPTRPATGTMGAAQVDLATNGGQAGGAADVTVGNGLWAMNVGGSARRSGNYDTPEGEVDNTQTRGFFGNVGVARTTANSYVGAGVQLDDTKYGVPVIEGGEIQLTPRRQVYSGRGEVRNMTGFFTSARGSVAYHRYRHEELEGDEVGTEFRNDLLDLDFRATHRPVGRLTGTVGVSGYTRTFEAVGAEALSPKVDQNVVSAFTYQEVSWSHATLQFGGRFDRASYDPAGGLRPRDFNNLSFSLGSLLRPTEQSTLAISLARAARNPALEELYFFGVHAGNFSFEVGNDDLDSEVSYGLDVSYRVRLPRVSAEVTYFNNTVDNYIFRSPLTEEEFDARFPGLEEEGHEEGHEEEGHHGDEEFPIVEFIGRDVRLQGVEAHADIDLSRGLHLELGLDTVRGELRDGGDPLPRIPPVRVTGGLRYHWNALQLGGQVVRASSQDRVYDIETPTDGFTTLRLFGAYSLQAGPTTHTFSARLDNVTNELFRNHLSLVKDLVPEMGRNFRVVWQVKF